MTIAFNHVPAWWMIGLLGAVVATCFYLFGCACLATRAGYEIAWGDERLDQDFVSSMWAHRWVLVADVAAALVALGLILAGLAAGRAPLVRAGLVAHAGLAVFQVVVLPRRIGACARRIGISEKEDEASG